MIATFGKNKTATESRVRQWDICAELKRVSTGSNQLDNFMPVPEAIGHRRWHPPLSCAASVQDVTAT
jgi:hypothetical protein